MAFLDVTSTGASQLCSGGPCMSFTGKDFIGSRSNMMSGTLLPNTTMENVKRKPSIRALREIKNDRPIYDVPSRFSSCDYPRINERDIRFGCLSLAHLRYYDDIKLSRLLTSTQRRAFAQRLTLPLARYERQFINCPPPPPPFVTINALSRADFRHTDAVGGQVKAFSPTAFLDRLSEVSRLPDLSPERTLEHLFHQIFHWRPAPLSSYLTRIINPVYQTIPRPPAHAWYSARIINPVYQIFPGAQRP